MNLVRDNYKVQRGDATNDMLLSPHGFNNTTREYTHTFLQNV